MIDAALVAHLKTLSGVTDLTSTRIYPDYAPQDATKPYVVVRLGDQTRYYASNGAVALTEAQLTINCYGDDYGAGRDVSEVIQKKPANGGISGFQGTMSTTGVRACFLRGPRSISTAPQSGQERADTGAAIDCEVWYSADI